MATTPLNHPTQPAPVSASTPKPTLEIQILPSSTLLSPSQKPTLRALCHLINDSFSAHGHPKDDGTTTPGALFLRKRLIHDEELPEGLGPEALTAICTDEGALDDEGDGGVDGDAVNGEMVGRRGKIVATGSLKLWKGKVVDLARSMQEAADVQGQIQTQTQSQHASNGHLTPTTIPSSPRPGLSNESLVRAEQTLSKTAADADTDSDSQTWNWEVKLCASLDTPHYRGRGLITRCVDALVAELKRRQAGASDGDGDGASDGERDSKGGDARGNMPIKLWITSLEGTGNTEYWVRRGFSLVGESEVAPRGTWESTRDIRIATLAKVVG